MRRRRVLVVGASSVLGGGIAAQLHAQGAELWLTYRTDGKRAELEGRFPGAQIRCVDLTKPGDLAVIIGELKAGDGARLDGLVYAAGAGLLWPAFKTSDAKSALVWELNVAAAQRVLREAFTLLAAGDRPAAVLISSIMGLVGAGGMSAYGASKAAVAGLARALAIEWAPRGIRVNAVAPGIVPSPLVDDMFKILGDEQKEIIQARHPLGWGEAADVGHAVEFLLSPRAKWITGVVLPVDGGYTAQ